MLNLFSNKADAFFICGSSIGVFIFSALLLIIPGGYSYGPALLLLLSFLSMGNMRKLQLTQYDWIFIFVLGNYFFCGVLVNIVHNATASNYDNLSRSLFAVPVYLFLLMYPPKKLALLNGLIIGALGAGALALYQKYHIDGVWVRSSGFLNPIQFGDISILLGGMLFCFIWRDLSEPYVISLNILILIAVALSFLASFLSWSRGGWLALPFILLVFFVVMNFKQRILLSIFLVLGVLSIMFLPDKLFLRERVINSYLDIINLFDGTYPSTSVSVRSSMWSNGILAFFSKPIFGWGGINEIREAFPLEWQPLHEQVELNHFHNEYIDVLAKKGLVGLISLLALFLIPLLWFVKLTKNWQLSVLPFSLAGIILISSVMMFGLTQCFLGHNSGSTIFIFYLVIITAYCRNIQFDYA